MIHFFQWINRQNWDEDRGAGYERVYPMSEQLLIKIFCKLFVKKININGTYVYGQNMYLEKRAHTYAYI